MITTSKISVNLSRGKLKLRQVTTKGIDASLRVEPPKEPIKPRGVSTRNLSDVADIIEKKRRDDIAVGIEKAKAKAKKPLEATKPPEAEKVAEVKKPWNKMNGAERKVYQAEKAKAEEVKK